MDQRLREAIERARVKKDPEAVHAMNEAGLTVEEVVSELLSMPNGASGRAPNALVAVDTPRWEPRASIPDMVKEILRDVGEPMTRPDLRAEAKRRGRDMATTSLDNAVSPLIKAGELVQLQERKPRRLALPEWMNDQGGDATAS